MADLQISSRSAQAARVMFLSVHDTPGGTTNYIKTLRQRFEHDGAPCSSLALYSGFVSDPSAFDEVVSPDRNPKPITYLKAIAGFVSRVRRSRPALIFTVMPMANVVAGLAAWFSGSKVLCTHHSPHDKNGRIVGILDMIMGTIGAYDSIVCVSSAVAKSYSRHPASYRDRVTVIPNGILALEPNTSRERIRAKYGIAPGRSFGLLVGRLAEQKNVLRTAEAMSSIHDADFLIAGAGPLERALRSSIEKFGASDRVRLIGVLERQEVINLLYACDVFVQASMFEGQSLALLEAAHARAKLVVSNIPEQLEVVATPEGTAAILCDPLDSEDIARAIRAVLFDPAAQRQVAAGADFLSGSVRTDEDTYGDYKRLVNNLTAQT